MIWLVPSALAIAAAAVVLALAVHLIARSRPLAEPFPTARFIPPRPVRARARAIAPSDLALLALRVAAIVALCTAVAAPVFGAARGRMVRIVAVDRSRSVADAGEVQDSVRSLLRRGDMLVVFDSELVKGGTTDSLRPAGAVGSLSVALAAAQRVGAELAARADSIELVVVSPMTSDEVDAATPRLRAAWPGRIRVVRTRVASMPMTSADVKVSGRANDAIAAGIALMARGRLAADVRVVRARLTANDSAWARDSAHVLVHWPSADSVAGWAPRAAIDAIGGVTSHSGTMIGRFPRIWVLNGATIARWSDGQPAAVEHPTGGGCIRDVGVLLDETSDLTLRLPFREFVAALLEPCAAQVRAGTMDSTFVSRFAGRGALATTASLRDPSNHESPWTTWLLLIGAVLLIVELGVRRSVRRPG